MKIFEKYKKLIFIFLPIFIFLSGGLLIKYNLPKVVEIILRVAIGPTISSQEINFPRFGIIEVRGLVLSSKKNVIVKAPKVVINYSRESLRNFRLEKIDVENPWVNIERKGSNVNIIEAFSNGKESKSKAGTAVPIDIVTVREGELTFRDLSYSREIQQDLKNVNGYISFNKKTGIDLEFKAAKQEERYEYRFNNSNEPLNMNIVLKDIKIRPEFVQYGYDDKDISGATGLFNMDLTIATSGLTGEAELKNGTVTYDGLSSKVENVNGKIDFKKNKIEVNFGFLLEENHGTFDVFYSEETGVAVKFKFKDLPYSVAANYKLLGDLNLPLNDLKFKNLDVKLSYERSQGFEAQVLYNGYPFVSSGVEIDNLSGKVLFKNGMLTLVGNNINMWIPSVGFRRELTYETTLDLNGENLKFNVVSNFVNLEGEYQKKDGILKIYQDKKLAMIYNFETKTLEMLDLAGSNLLNDYDFFLRAQEKNGIINFEKLSLVNNEGQMVLKIMGDLDRKNLKYNFNIQTQNLQERDLFDNLKLNVELDFKGEIAGEREKFILRGVAKNIKLKNEDIYLSAYANVSVAKDKDIQANIQGELRELKYRTFEIQGVKTDFVFENNKLLISSIRNELFEIKGEVGISEKTLNLDYNITGLKSSEFKKSSFDVLLNSVQGQVMGSFEDLKVNAQIKEAFLEMPNKELVTLNGEIFYKNNVVSTERFKLNQSLATVEYDVKTKNGKFSLNILEENLPKYYGFKALNYRVLSRVEGRIRNGNIEANAGVNIDRVYLNNSVMPNVSSNLRYIKNDRENRIHIDNLELLNLRGRRLLFSRGNVNLMNKTLEYNIPNQRLNLRDFESIINVNNMSGNIRIEGNASGNLNDLRYNLRLFEGRYEIKGFNFTGISLNLAGDRNVLRINEILAFYERNVIRGRGEFIIPTQEYNLNIFSQNIDLSFLNGILPRNSIRDIGGRANIDLRISNNSRGNSGYINLINFNANIPQALLELSNLNMNLRVESGKLRVSSLAGRLNGGRVRGEGYLRIPTLEEIRADNEFYKNLDYTFNVALENVIFQLKGFFRINLSGDLNYSANRVSGNISINEGEITGILREERGLISKILNFIIERSRSIIGQNRQLGRNFETTRGTLNQTPEFNVGVMIRNGININISDISTFVQDVRGVLSGRFNILGRNENIRVVGELEIQRGRFVLGSEDFIVTRALLLADRRNGLITNFNPNLIFEVFSRTSRGRVEISLQGELNSLRLTVTTNQGRRSSSLKNIFDRSGAGSDRDAVALLFKTIIDSQISNTLLRPISRTLQNVFNISKFRIGSDIFNRQALSNSDNSRAQDPNIFGFGAYIEAENPIYRDKFFWTLRLGIIDGTRYNTGGNQNRGLSNNVNQFDFRVERRFVSGWSYGVGVSKLNEANVVDVNRSERLNYYVDFKFERKYNSIKDIFSNKN